MKIFISERSPSFFSSSLRALTLTGVNGWTNSTAYKHAHMYALAIIHLLIHIFAYKHVSIEVVRVRFLLLRDGIIRVVAS